MTNTDIVIEFENIKEVNICCDQVSMKVNNVCIDKIIHQFINCVGLEKIQDVLENDFDISFRFE